jgi:hypothetical protein
MKYIISMAFLRFMLYSASAQSPNNVYCNTLTLLQANKKLAVDVATWNQVLKNYVPVADQGKITTEADIRNYFKDNPFKLADYMQHALAAPAAVSSVNIGSFSTNLSASNLTGILTDVIIERAKEELVVAFFDRFKKELGKYPELDSIFPKTSAFIMNIESYLYAGSLNTLRQAFSTDLANLPGTLPLFLKSADIQKFIGSNPRYKNIAILVPAFCFIGKLLNGGNLGDAILELSPNDNVKAVDRNLYSILKIVPVLSQSVRDPSSKNVWIDMTTDFRTRILADPTAAHIFFGLLYEELKYIPLYNSSGTEIDWFNTLDFTKINNVTSIITNVQNAYTNLNAILVDLKKLRDNSDTATLDQIINLINTSASDAQVSLIAINDLVNQQIVDEDVTIQLVSFVPQLSGIVKNIYAKEYSTAVMNVILLLNQFVQDDDRHVSSKVLKYASFMASMAEAKTSNDISTALQSAILPVGSSSIKSSTAISFSINSYIGAGYYSEHYNDPQAQVKTNIPTFSVSLPIGLAINKGLRWKIIGSASIFASVLDLGAIAAFKLKTPDNTQTQSLPQFAWQNLLAPGGYLVLGRILNTPLAIGAGWQKGPQLRTITYTMSGGTTIDLSDKNVYRFGAFLSVDIPLFNLYSVPYKKPYNQ